MGENHARQQATLWALSLPVSVAQEALLRRVLEECDMLFACLNMLPEA